MNTTVPQKSLTTEQPAFDRANGLRLATGELSLRRWDVDPDIVEQRLRQNPVVPRPTTEWAENG